MTYDRFIIHVVKMFVT